MKRLLESSLSAAMDRLTEHVKLVRGEHDFNVDEATFRSFVLAEIKRYRPEVRCQIEWNRFDLLLLGAEGPAVVEFKFHFPGRRLSLDGTWGGWKGRPGPKNEGEFAECIAKLMTKPPPEIRDRFLVLAYTRETPEGVGAKSFVGSYDDLVKFGVTNVVTIEHADSVNATCKLIEVNNA